MHAADLTRAAQRLRHSPLPSPETVAAVKLLAESPSKANLIEALACDKSAPVALEIFCALEIECEQVFEAVRCSIEHNLALCWALVESLNHLPWYGGIRAFLSLEDPPESSPCTYAFYILARNKLFTPTTTTPEQFEYCYRGLWRLLPVARSETWQSPHDSVLAIVAIMDKHLRMPSPDPFVVYLAGLLLGRISPLKSNLDALRLRAHGDGDRAVRTTAHLARKHIQSLQSGMNSHPGVPHLPVTVG